MAKNVYPLTCALAMVECAEMHRIYLAVSSDFHASELHSLFLLPLTISFGLGYSFSFNIYLFLWLHWVSGAAGKHFSCSMWFLVPQPGIEPRLPALRAWSLSHWTTREVPVRNIFMHIALSFLEVSSLGCISRSTITESNSGNIFVAL